jgi:hypothetical protein
VNFGMVFEIRASKKATCRLFTTDKMEGSVDNTCNHIDWIGFHKSRD